jgi:hypothetical protein
MKWGCWWKGQTPLALRESSRACADWACAACRFWQSYLRNVPYNGTRFIFAVVLALLFGSILWNVGHKKCAPGAAFKRLS